MFFIEPAQPKLRASPPVGDGWLHEVKFDGYCIQLHKFRRSSPTTSQDWVAGLARAHYGHKGTLSWIQRQCRSPFRHQQRRKSTCSARSCS